MILWTTLGGDPNLDDTSLSLNNDLTSDLFDDVDDETQDDANQQPLHHDAVSNGSEITFDDFAAGEDEVTLHLTDDGSGDFVIEPLQDEDGETVGVSLSYLDGDTETTLNFPGLVDVPAEDITIGITSQETGKKRSMILKILVILARLILTTLTRLPCPMGMDRMIPSRLHLIQMRLRCLQVKAIPMISF